MRNASSHNYRNSSFIVDLAMGQIPRSTERMTSVSNAAENISILFATALSFIHRNSHTGFRLVPISMTLNDLERRNRPYFAFFSLNSIDF